MAVIAATFFFIMSLLLLSACVRPPTRVASPEQLPKDTLSTVAEKEPDTLYLEVDRNISVEDYFPFMDSVLSGLDTLLGYPLSEHILVWANPWIVDTLVNTDYYYQMVRGNFVYDQRKLTVLPQGSRLGVPGEAQASAIQQRLAAITLDVNIPEYTLRLCLEDSVLHSFPVRVGRNEHKYLETAGRVVDLRTPIGKGKIVRIDRDPYFVDPVTGEAFTTTRRDDGKRTMMPQIPWLEPEINGIRYGSMIHPTTNPRTLGKAYSNGCIGTPEGAAWLIYYHVLVGTAVNFRYDLQVTDEDGNNHLLKDIYRARP